MAEAEQQMPGQRSHKRTRKKKVTSADTGQAGKPEDKSRAPQNEASQKEEGIKVITEEMLAYTRERFPDLQTSTYFVPSQLFTRSSETPAHPLYQIPVQKNSDTADLGCNRAESDVMRCLRHIEEMTSETMFVLFNYAFDNYLKKDISQTPSKQSRSAKSRKQPPDFRKQFSKAKDLFETPATRGDFDTLIVSPKHGFVVVETKAVGYNEDKDMESLQKRVSRGMAQLVKSDNVLRHLFSDISVHVNITKALALPNVQRELLSQMLDAYPSIAKEIQECFQVDSVEEALKRVLSADDVNALSEGGTLKSGQGEATSHPVLKWWENVTKGPDTSEAGAKAEQLSMDAYEKIVSRLVGQYSKVTVESRKDAPEARTVADCIHLTGLRFGRFILRPDQLDVLDSQDKFVFLTGPPGSGKTLILGLKAVEWARAGDHVIIVGPEGIVWGTLVTWTLYNQVLSALQGDQNPKKQGRGSQKQKDSSKKSSGANQPGASAKEKTLSDADYPAEETKGIPPDSEKMRLGDRTLSDADCSTEETKGILPNFEELRLADETVPKQTAQHSETASCGPCGSDPSFSGSTSTESDDATKRVHFHTVSIRTDPEHFVQDLLAKYKGRAIRLVVDECPSKMKPDQLYSTLGESHRCLLNVKSSLQELVDAERRNEKQAQYAHGSHNLPADAESNTDKKADFVKAYGKIEHHHKTIQERLSDFQSPNGKPSVTQTAEWKFYVQNIQDTCQDIEQLLQEITNLLVLYDERLLSSVSLDSLKVLERVEATMLDASGFLFNVDTSLGSFVLSDIFLVIRTQHTDQNITVWSCGVFPSYQPEGFMVKQMTQCLRCPPKVQKNHPGYTYQSSSITDNMFPLPTDGPDVKLLDHSSHMTKVKNINDCWTCGEALVDYIEMILRDGSESGLRLEDIVIGGSFDISGIRCEFLQALSSKGIAFEYEGNNLTTAPPYPGKTFVVGGSALQGLEAKVVVFIPDVLRIPAPSADADNKEFRQDLPSWLRNLGRWNRCHLWFVASRCLSQLVVFHV